MEGSFGFPIKYGYASIGEVHGVGKEVTTLQAGDQVFVHYPHQSAYVVDASHAFKLPLGLPAAHGVFLASLETAFNAMLDSRLHLGETIAIFGQGVVGLLLTQLARRAGAELIIAIDRFERRRALARQLGADIVLTPDDDSAERIRAYTDGRGADVVVEVSGAPEALVSAIRAVADQATVLVVSWYGTKLVTVPLGEELKAVQLFIDLQKTRFEDALVVNMNIDDEHYHRKIVPVTLQNLVENAIKHNVADNSAPLQIDLFVKDDYLLVQNNLQKKNFVETSNKQGLANMESLYHYLSDRPMLIKEDENNFTVKIPLL